MPQPNVALELSMRNARELATLVKRCEEDPEYSQEALERLHARRDEAQKIVEDIRAGR